jgi:XapX domain-containing protein
MREIVMSILAGIVVGIIFKLLKLPIPAPPVLPAVLGIFGLYLGGKIAELVLQMWGK